ncbi:hypothetical protein EBU71_17645, partial [bacterium]|nr:hypothetical protein [Candidatus Elulimicrobium humile]
MSGTEMKNAVLITLVVLVVLFVLYQYDPSLMGLLRSNEGFKDVMKADGAKPSGEAHGDKKPNQLPSSGKNEKFQNERSGFVNAVKSENFQSNGTMGNELKNQPEGKKNNGGEGFADLSAYEGPAQFGSAEAPAGCYPRDQLTPSELLPKDMNSI